MPGYDCTCDLGLDNYSYGESCTDPQQVLRGPAQVYVIRRGSDQTVWTDVGPTTRDGVTVNLEFETRKVLADRHPHPIRAWTYTRDIEIEFALLHNNLFNVLAAMNSDTYGYDATTGYISQICATGNHQEIYYMLSLAVPFADADEQLWERHMTFPRVILTGSGPLEFKCSEESPIPVKFTAVGAHDISGCECAGISAEFRDVQVVS